MVFRALSACMMTLPPSPPSPPSGPPRSMYFSRRKLRQPLPPLPAKTLMVASSTNFITWIPLRADTRRQHWSRYPRAAQKKAPSVDEASGLATGSALRAGYLHKLAPVGATGDEFDFSVGRREQRVILAAADVLAGVETRAALTNQDVPRTYRLPAKPL